MFVLSPALHALGVDTRDNRGNVDRCALGHKSKSKLLIYFFSFFFCCFSNPVKTTSHIFERAPAHNKVPPETTI